MPWRLSNLLPMRCWVIQHRRALQRARRKRQHGFWPTRPDYHSIILLSGPAVGPERLGEIEMVTRESRFEAALGIHCGAP